MSGPDPAFQGRIVCSGAVWYISYCLAQASDHGLGKEETWLQAQIKMAFILRDA